MARGWLQVEASGRGIRRMKYTPRLALLLPHKSSASVFPWANPAGSPRAGSGHVVCRGQPRRIQSWRREEPDVHGMISMWLVSLLPLCPRPASPQHSQSKEPSRANIPPPGNEGAWEPRTTLASLSPQPHPQPTVPLALRDILPKGRSGRVFLLVATFQ